MSMFTTTHEIQKTLANGTPDERVVAAMTVLARIDEWMPWLEARRFDGMTITGKDDDWLIVLRATYKKRKQVAFVAEDTLEEALIGTAHRFCFGLLQWKEDQFRSMRSDKNQKA